MIRIIKDKTYKFVSMFNTNTGEYIRGLDVEEDLFMAEYPHLIDVGVMGHCQHGRSGLCLKAGIKCYQNGLEQNKPNMTLENYKKIIDESKDRLFEIALGGRGDPDMHEDFEGILAYSRKHNVVPNFTTSGLGMTSEKAAICKKYCGAVAVSMYSRLQDTTPLIAYRKLDADEKSKVYKSEEDVPVRFTFGNVFDDSCQYKSNMHNVNGCYIDEPFYVIDGKKFEWDEQRRIEFSDTPVRYEYFKVFEEAPEKNYTMEAIKMLMDEGVKTNIHFVLSNTTIDEALIRVKHNGFPKGINAVVFLLHKPVGLGGLDDVLDVNDPRVKEFFELVDKGNLPYKVGFDSCSIPGVLKWSKHIDTCSIDTCEGSRFSMYIDADMTALPCSFDNQDKKYAVQLSDTVSIETAWNSDVFNRFRNSLRNSCKDCKQRELCMGGCPLRNDVVLCDSVFRDFALKEG